MCVDGSTKYSPIDAILRGPGFEWYRSEADEQRKAGQDVLNFVCQKQTLMQSTQRARAMWICTDEQHFCDLLKTKYRVYSCNLRASFSSLAAEKSGCVKYADFFFFVEVLIWVFF
jgi:hypothetical protein